MPSQTVNYATNIALIKNGSVENVIWGMIYGLAEYERWGYEVVVVNDLAVEPGDTYNEKTKKFYDKNGNVVKTIYEIHEEEIEELDNYIIELAYEDIIGDVDISQ